MYFSVFTSLLLSTSCTDNSSDDMTDNRQDSPTHVSVNGHEFVNLGLPSGLKWATCNVGAHSPEEPGDYFAWGEVTPKSNYADFNYKWGVEYEFKKYAMTKYTEGSKTTLDAEDDAATYNWGNDCRMPSREEYQELYNNCSCEWTTMNGRHGYLLTGKNGASIFFPATGYYMSEKRYLYGVGGSYWSRSLYISENNPNQNPRYYSVSAYTWGFYSDRDFDNCNNSMGRDTGRSVRAVCR